MYPIRGESEEISPSVFFEQFCCFDFLSLTVCQSVVNTHKKVLTLIVVFFPDLESSYPIRSLILYSKFGSRHFFKDENLSSLIIFQ